MKLFLLLISLIPSVFVHAATFTNYLVVCEPIHGSEAFEDALARLSSSISVEFNQSDRIAVSAGAYSSHVYHYEGSKIVTVGEKQIILGQISVQLRSQSYDRSLLHSTAGSPSLIMLPGQLPKVCIGLSSNISEQALKEYEYRLVHAEEYAIRHKKKVKGRAEEQRNLIREDG